MCTYVQMQIFTLCIKVLIFKNIYNRLPVENYNLCESLI